MSYLPTSVTGCQLWLDASDSSSLVLSGSNVTTWNDKSGSNYHMNTLTATADWSGTATYPTIGTPINGLQTVNFLAQSGLRQSTTLDGVKNLFWVGRIAAPNGTGGIHTSYFILGHETFYDWHGLAYGQKFLDPAIATAGIQNASPTSLFTSDVNAITNTAFANVFKPSAPNVSILSVAGITGSTRYQGLCFDRTYHFGWCGDLAEVIIYSTALSTEQRQTTETYLAQKWGLISSLPAGHPGFVYIPPRQKLLNIPKAIISTIAYLPTSIAGCQLWLDGNDPLGTGTQPANGAIVSTWFDKSVNGRNGTQVNNPTFDLARKAIYFSGSQYYNLPNSTFPSGNSSYTYFMIVNFSIINSGGVLAGGGFSGSDSIGFRNNGPGGGFYAYWFGNDIYSSTSYSANQIVSIVSFFTTGSSRTLIQNFTTTNTAGGGRNQPATNNTVGKSYGGEYMTGYIHEVIVYNVELNTTQRQEVESYLAQKWAITSLLGAGHPGRTTQVYGSVTTLVPTTFVSTYSPTSITGCALWLDAMDTSTLTGSSPVTAWRDKSSNAYSFNGTGAVTSNFISSERRSLFFNGSSYLTNNSMSITNPFTVFTVGYQTANLASTYQRMLNGINNTNYDYYLFVGCFGSNVATFIANGSSWNDVNANNPATLSFLSGNIICSTVSAGTITTYVNGTTLDTKSGNTTPTFTGLNIGGGYGTLTNLTNQSWNGHVGEIILYSGVLTTTQRQQVESYLAQKWSLTASLVAGHPGITTSVYQVTLPLPKQKFISLPRALTVITYSPASIAGCQLWLDGEDSSFMTVAAGKVSQWRDKSGSNNHATSPSSIRDPTLTANAQNSKSVITFSGSQNFTGPITLGTIFTQFIVYFNSSGRIGQGLMDSNDASLLGKLAYQEGGSECFQSGFGFSYQRFFKTGGAYRILMTKCSNPSSSATVSHWFNGTDQNISSGIWTIYGGNSTAISSYTIAARGDLIYFIGTIAEIIIYNSVISLDQQREVEAYLGQKWGISSSLPAGHIGRTTFSYQTTVIPPKQKIRAIIPLISYTRTFSYTGSNQTFVVPVTTTSITVYMWAAGGGGYHPTQSYGGAGCYLTGILSVNPGETLSILVGQGGTVQFPAQSGLATRFGGGGGIISTGGNANSQYNGSGGGRSAIQRSGTDIVSAGGGGGCGTRAGGGNGYNGGTGSWTGTGGNGASDKFGLGGTQSAGGASQGNGQAGSALIGGQSDPWGGGGGGGYYGGGGGSDNNSFGSGGGGGSSDTRLLSNVSGSNGTLNVAPNTESIYYVSGIAVGGTQALSGNGGNGCVVFVYMA